MIIINLILLKYDKIMYNSNNCFNDSEGLPINNSEFEEGKKLLQEIVDSKSGLKFLAEDIISK